MAKTKRRSAFGAVGTGLQIGHGLVAVATVGVGLLVVVQLSPAHRTLGRWDTTQLGMGVLAIFVLHILLMLTTPLWHWLAVRTQTKVSRLWAWLGYFIPLASYWLPARNLSQLIDGSTPETATLRTLVLAWGVTRSLAAPLVVAAIIYGLYKLGPTSNITAGLAVAYTLLIITAANLLSLLTIGRMQRHFATAAVDERHAEIFT